MYTYDENQHYALSEIEVAWCGWAQFQSHLFKSGARKGLTPGGESITVSLLSTIISTPFELETSGWSQIQAEEKILPDLIYYLRSIHYKLKSIAS